MDEKIINFYFNLLLNQEFDKINNFQKKYHLNLSVVNHNNDTVFHYILKNCNDQSIIKNIIKNYPQILTINSKNNQGQTPFHLICMNQFNEIYVLIPKEKIDLNIKDNKDLTSYDYSIIGKELTHSINTYIFNYLINTNKNFKLGLEKLNKLNNYDNYILMEQEMNKLLNCVFKKKYKNLCSKYW